MKLKIVGLEISLEKFIFTNFFDVFLAYIIMYIENQASGHSPPPIAPHYPSAYCGLA